MLLAEQHITQKQDKFKSHPFFLKLKEQDDFVRTMDFASRLAFWVMAFQDVLRLIPPRVESKELRRVATHHKMEDGGHDLWFLQDMSLLNKDKNYNIAWLFSKENNLVRDFSYKVLSEALTLTNDHEKIALILILESTGHVFFEKISDFAKLKNYDSQLKYFSSYHLDVEKSHAVFEDELMQSLLSIKLSDRERAEVIDLIDRVYTGFNAVFDELHTCLVEVEEENKRLVA